MLASPNHFEPESHLKSSEFPESHPRLRCDFHCHSNHSDGILSPTALAEAMKASAVNVFALTDHDTVSGVREAQAAARKHDIRCLGGIELTIQWDNGTFHLLGLGLKNLEALEEPLAEIQERRQERNRDILKKLRKQGIDIDSDKVLQHCGKKDGDILNRSHIAAYLADFDHCKSYREAFQRYLGIGAPAYVAIEGPSPEEGIEWIHSAGGYALIAHPYSLRLNRQRLRYYIDMWSKMGLDGLELSHPNTATKDSKHMMKLVQLYDMQYCGGSDYHRGKTEKVLGLGTAGRPIDLPANLPFLQN
ncbi:PHP domain-containing protein [Candidatus Haliotispira prima]|uniref:PHP domain-containing protein n=1 Tax=Candidatus Haliotispira prima TaxID=3034016 RepID=A0ABY8MEK0_9SPIO|nr:PHP domain-containing protein [Candidatus Haliotispira prima]